MATPRSSIDASSSIDAVQQEVIDSFVQVDENVRIHKTGYFNHTYAPDIVLKWVGQKEERHVFLRASDNEEYLREDIDLLQDKDPIFAPLNGIAEPGEATSADERRRALRDTSVSARALVTQPESIRVLGESARTQPINSLAARAVLQGGAGIVSPALAAAFNETVADGFRGALLGDEEATGEAIRLSNQILDERRTSQLTELLQAAWIGGGQIGTDFPGLGFPTSALEPEALLLLLNTVSVDDGEFWQRLARNLEMRHFSGLTISTQNAGFQQLMKAAAPRLKAKAARTVGIGSASDAPQTLWAINKGILSLALGRARIDFAARSADDFGSDGYEALPSVATFIERATSAEMNILRIVLSDGDRRLEYVSEDGTSVTNDDRILDLANDFHGAVVARAIVAAEGRDLGVNLESSTSFGHTRSIFYVSTLAQSLLPLVMDLDAGEQHELREVFAFYEDGRASNPTDRT